MPLFNFIIAVILCAIPTLALLLIGLFLWLTKVDKLRGARLMYNADICIATMIYGTAQRTLSGICGEGKLKGKGHYRVIANFIDMLFGENHCVDAHHWEQKNHLTW